MSNELELKTQLDPVQFKKLLKILHLFKFYIPKKYQKDVVYTLQETPNKQNLLRIRKQGHKTFLTYKQICFKDNKFIGCNEFEEVSIFNLKINKVFSKVNAAYGLRADTNFKLKVKDLDKYISRVYAPFIKSKDIVEKIRKEAIIFKLKNKKITIALDEVKELGYFLEIEYLSDEKLSDEAKLKIRSFLEYFLQYIFDVKDLIIVKKGYLTMLKE